MRIEEQVTLGNALVAFWWLSAAITALATGHSDAALVFAVLYLAEFVDIAGKRAAR